jgi:ferredoxin, 2Fe-2S
MAAASSCEIDMPTITFIEPNGAVREVAAAIGESLMIAATRDAVDGIVGECGGSAMCATCHCYLEAGELPAPQSLEADTIEFTALNVQPNSRLTCQVIASEAMKGVTLRVAPR